MLRIRQPIPKWLQIGLGLAGVAAIFVGYAVIARFHPSADQLVPGAKSIIAAIRTTITPHALSGDVMLVQDGVATAGRLAAGLGVGVLIALVLGMLMGVYPAVAAFFGPPLSILAKVPPTAALAIFLALTAAGELQFFVSLIVFGITPTLTQSVWLAARDGVPAELIDKALTLGASQFEIVVRVILRQVLPTLMEAIRLSIGPAIVFLIAAEWIAADEGFGMRIRLDSRALKMSRVYFYLAVLAGAGWTLDWAMRMAVRQFCPWYGRQ
ncbi:MAG: ABC transporter permease [Phycisphaerales bacterium]